MDFGFECVETNLFGRENACDGTRDAMERGGGDDDIHADDAKGWVSKVTTTGTSKERENDVIDDRRGNLKEEEGDAGSVKRRRVDADDDDETVRDVDGKGVLDRCGATVKVGDRLEVQWEVVVVAAASRDDEDEEDADADARRVRWWPCVVVRDDVRDDDGDGGMVKKGFGLVYDAMDGFESERRRVVFSRAGGARQLEHAGEAGVFRWRREGDVDDVQRDDDDEYCDEEDVENAIEDAPTTMREILEAQGAIDAENGGVSLESAAMGAFATLPMNQQMNMATAFAGFKEKLMAKLSGLAAEKGAEGVVTKDDIDGILSDIQKGA